VSDRQAGEPPVLEVRNPATGAPAGAVAVDSAASVAGKAARLRANQAEWEALGVKGRYRWLGRLRDWLLDNEGRVADTMQAETGKVRAEATGEVLYLADLINFYGARAAGFLAEQKVRPHTLLMAGKKQRIRYRPYPLVGVIGPWNFPLVLSLGDAIPALQAGTAVLIKPSELTPLSLAEVVAAWKEIGAPDVLDCVQGGGGTGEALVDAADFVQFTGSDRTGRRVMERAARTLTPVSLELGGKDAMIVLADADPERAANAACYGSMMNAGQVCISVERVYVEEPVYERFVDNLVSAVGELRQGVDGAEFGSDVGAMTSPAQTAIVEAQVEAALAAGARALTGGARVEAAGDYFEPTVLVDVDPAMEVMRDESFGPLVSVVRVRDEEEAVRLANDSRYGLAGSVFGGRQRAVRVARRLECGAVSVNDVIFNPLLPSLPFGGWKQSGIGTRFGEAGIRKFCRTESLVVTRFGGRRELGWHPYTRARRRRFGRIARAFIARDWRRRLGL
jgi:acyl-CoA reductase-like NAD-dependent aldehyde dehydrogenase